MPETPQKFFLTTPIYYVNARPHIGHAYTTIVADVLARRARAQGRPTYFLTGTDEHGQKIERSAQAAGIPPRQFADEVSATFSTLWQRMGITHDDFIRTTSARHKRGVQKLFKTLQANGKIELKSYTGSYCVSDEAFVDLPAGAPCPDCGRPLETVTEQNYFFKLSEYQLPLIDLIESNTLSIQPDSRRNEVLSFLRGPVSDVEKNLVILSEAKDPCIAPIERTGLESGNRQDPCIAPSSESPRIAHSALGNPYVPGTLKDLSISRTSFKWGIPVPNDEEHVIYVWLDALANYMTALGYGAGPEGQDGPLFQEFWPADLHIVGKEIIRFHCVYWPAFLLAAGLPLPRQVVAHGWLLFEESKMSKSRGNIVRTETILDAFGPLCPPPTAAAALSENPATALPENPATALPENIDSPQNLVILSEAKDPCISPPPTASPDDSNAPKNSTDATRKGTPSGVPQTPPYKNMLGPSGPNMAADTDPDALPPTDATLKGTTSVVPYHAPPQTPALAADGLLSAEAAQTSLKHHQDLFASDVLRYFLLREIPFGQDGSFSFDALITRYNADLANGYGNLVSRTLNMINSYCGGYVPEHITWDTITIQIFDEETSLYIAAQVAAPQLANDAYAMVKFYQQAFAKLRFALPLDPELAKNTRAGVIDTAMYLVSRTDSFITSNAPWKLAKQPEKVKELHEVLYLAAESIRIVTLLLNPILPYATAKVWAQLGLDPAQLTTNNKQQTTWGLLQPGTKLGPLAPIFPRADKGLAQIMNDMENPAPIACVTGPNDPPSAQNQSVPSESSLPSLSNPGTTAFDPAAPPRTTTLAEPNPGTHVAASAAILTERPATPSHTEAQASGIFASQPTDSSPQITIEDFAKIELRVAQVVVAERIPKADKLLRLEVDLGYEKRQILSGIAEWYTPEELIGRRIVVITNLAPRKMRGLESHGMLLAASAPAAEGEPGGKPHLATFAAAETLPLGSRLK